MNTPLQQAAYDIGAKGSEPIEEERLAFESWMRGHCWAVIGEWDGKQYKHAHESTGFVHGGAMETRRLWAAWRDRGAVARVLAGQAQAVEPTTTKTEQIAGAISKHISTPLIQREVIEAAQYIVHRYMRPAPPASERAKVGDSNFESWYAETKIQQMGTKQRYREAYEAGLNEAQQVAAPDMFWNHDDAEKLYSSISEFLNDEMCNDTELAVGDIRTIQQAVRLPNIDIRITSVDEDECDAEYEIVEAQGAKPC